MILYPTQQHYIAECAKIAQLPKVVYHSNNSLADKNAELKHFKNNGEFALKKLTKKILHNLRSSGNASPKRKPSKDLNLAPSNNWIE